MFQKIKNAFKAPVNVNEVIAEIHESFDTATERLLKEANDIVSKTGQYSIDKSERLKGLGFRNSKTVVDTSKAIEAKKKMEEVSKIVIDFKVRYPNNKFITEEMVNAICEKYNLVFADVSYFKGDVPEKNLSEIENFKLADEDMERTSNVDDYYRRRNLFSPMNSPFGSLPSFANVPTELIFRNYKREFKICAPESDFDMTYLHRKGNKLELNIPDPIVLQPVKGGYLIVSKWGLEGADKDLVNETMN